VAPSISMRQITTYGKTYGICFAGEQAEESFEVSLYVVRCHCIIHDVV